MEQIREGIFETNSSSTHTLTMCTKSEFDRWKSGELVYDIYDEKLVPYTEEIRKIRVDGVDDGYMTYDDFNDWSYKDYLERFEQHYTTPGGEEIVGFGTFGYDD